MFNLVHLLALLWFSTQPIFDTPFFFWNAFCTTIFLTSPTFRDFPLVHWLHIWWVFCCHFSRFSTIDIYKFRGFLLGWSHSDGLVCVPQLPCMWNTIPQFWEARLNLAQDFLEQLIIKGRSRILYWKCPQYLQFEICGHTFRNMNLCSRSINKIDTQSI